MSRQNLSILDKTSDLKLIPTTHPIYKFPSGFPSLPIEFLKFVFCFEFTHNSGMNVCLVCFDACWWFQSPGLLNGATFDPITECIISHYILDKFQVFWFRAQMPNDFTAWYLLLWCHSVISVDSSKLLCNIWGILTSCGIVGFDKVGKTAYCNP